MKILLLGNTGKMGTALSRTFDVIGVNRTHFNAENPSEVHGLIIRHKPDIVMNTVAFLGIDPCEQNPDKAFALNALLPKLLSKLSNDYNFTLVHFSTDAVFDGKKQDYYIESDMPAPINIYGMTKYCGDCFVQSIAKKYYIIRVSLLFGESSKETQFVEKMLSNMRSGEYIPNGEKVLRIAGDIIVSPTHSEYVAERLESILNYEYGLYHVANLGQASLYDLMEYLSRCLNLEIFIERCSYKDFPHIGAKNTFTPLASVKHKHSNYWTVAVEKYCERIDNGLIFDERT